MFERPKYRFYAIWPVFITEQTSHTMALTYSLRYKKLNFFQKVLLEKEGEIIIERQSFKLKGKGAQDTGENVFFADIKEMVIGDDNMSFSTYKKERFVLTGFVNLFDSFLKDFFRVRNEFFADACFMKKGMLINEYDGNVEVMNSAGKSINKGKSRIQFYEGSIVIIPEARECTMIYYDFIKMHEFDEDDYLLKLYLDNGSNVHISKLGTSFEDVQEVMENQLSKMYEKTVNALKEFLPDFDAMTLVKLATKVKGGKALQYSCLKKIHEDLPRKMYELVFKDNPIMRDKAEVLRKHSSDENFYLGLSFFNNPETRDIAVNPWFLIAIAEQNALAMGICRANEIPVHFFRIVIEQGEVKEKIASKILEIDQTVTLFKLDMTPIMKDKRELKKSKYKTAIKKLSFLRLLRKSYMGKNSAADSQQFMKDLDKIFAKSKLLDAPKKENIIAKQPV